jgi:thiol:disulfide interchange protein DsbA
MKLKNIKSIMICSALSIAITACGNESKEDVQIEKDSTSVAKISKNVKLSPSVNMVEAIYREGVHYKIIEKPLFKPANQVMEIFSYTCPHCYSAENELVNPWKKEGGNVTFDIVHSSYNSFLLESKVFYTFKELSREDLHASFFKFRQSIRGRLSDKSLNEFVLSTDLNESEFYSVLESDKVNKRISNTKRIEEMLDTGSVPTFLIGGKYLINGRSLKSLSEIKTLSEYLIANKP